MDWILLLLLMMTHDVPDGQVTNQGIRYHLVGQSRMFRMVIKVVEEGFNVRGEK